MIRTSKLIAVEYPERKEMFERLMEATGRTEKEKQKCSFCFVKVNYKNFGAVSKKYLSCKFIICMNSFNVENKNEEVIFRTDRISRAELLSLLYK